MAAGTAVAPSEWKISRRDYHPAVLVRPLASVDVDQADITWLNTAKAAERLGVTPRTLYRFIDDGQLPAYRFGRVIRLKADEVEEFIERCRIAPGTLDITTPEPTHDLRDSATKASESK